MVLPTDTVYGLAADPRFPGAQERLYAAKGRAEDKPIAFLASDIEVIEVYGALLDERERRLAEHFWPGALTLVLKTPDAAASGPCILEGFRIPDYDFTRLAIRACGTPLRVTSANRSGMEAARTAEEAVAMLKGSVSLVIDGGPAPGGKASSVVQVSDEQVLVLREEAISRNEIMRIAQ